MLREASAKRRPLEDSRYLAPGRTKGRGAFLCALRQGSALCLALQGQERRQGPPGPCTPASPPARKRKAGSACSGFPRTGRQPASPLRFPLEGRCPAAGKGRWLLASKFERFTPCVWGWVTWRTPDTEVHTAVPRVATLTLAAGAQPLVSSGARSFPLDLPSRSSTAAEGRIRSRRAQC